jgi:hypothetical protein
MHGELRFGVVVLIGRPQSWLWFDFSNLTETQRKSIQRFYNPAYWQCAAKCRDTAFKLTESLYKLSHSLSIMENQQQYNYDGAPIETAAVYYQALQDAPYHLDAFISYLRILADCICFALPFFYQTRESITNRSFRDQMRWFLEKKPKFDEEYTAILRKHTSWFELLSGKGEAEGSEKGIRDLNYHHFATYQFGSTVLPNGQHQILISQVTSKGIVHQNVLATLEEITYDLFEYLDRVYELFVGRFSSEIPQYAWNLEANSVLMKLKMEEMQSKYRLYPLILSG